MVEILGGLVLVLVTLAALARTLPAAWSFVKGFARLVATIEEIAEEFKPNGGNSLRDQINRIHHRLDKIEQKIGS